MLNSLQIERTAILLVSPLFTTIFKASWLFQLFIVYWRIKDKKYILFLVYLEKCIFIMLKEFFIDHFQVV